MDTDADALVLADLPPADDCVRALGDASAEVRMRSVRFLKNSIIGSRTRKGDFARAGAVGQLIKLLQDAEPGIAVQAACALGSFGHGLEEHCRQVGTRDAILGLLRGLQNPDPGMVLACVRSLKIIYSSAHQPHASVFDVSDNATATAEVLVGLLRVSGLIQRCAAALIHSCCTAASHSAVLDNRGATALLVAMVFAKAEARPAGMLVPSLEALAAMLRHGAPSIRDKIPAHSLGVLLLLLKGEQPAARLSAAEVLTHLVAGRSDAAHCDAALQTLEALTQLAHGADLALMHKTSLVVVELVSGSEELQGAACIADLISRLTCFFHRAESNPAHATPLTRGALEAFAVLCELREENRKLLIATRALRYVVAALSDSCGAVRLAACKCARSLTRSVKTLRTTLVDVGIAEPLFNLLRDTELEVKIVASAAVCNLVMEFSPMKKIVLAQSGVETFVGLSLSDNAELRRNGVWALKNLLYQAPGSNEQSAQKLIIDQLQWPNLKKLLRDANAGVREQAFAMLRNLMYGQPKDVNTVVRWFGGIQELLSFVQEGIGGETPSTVVCQAMYVLCNAAHSSESHKSAVIEDARLLMSLREVMQRGEDKVLVPCLWTVINLIWHSDTGGGKRAERLVQEGILQRVRVLEGHADQDVKDRAKAALELFRRWESLQVNLTGAHVRVAKQWW